MQRFPLRVTFAFLTLAVLAATPRLAYASANTAKRSRYPATARHVSLLPLRAKIDTGGRFFDEPQWIDRDTVIAHANIPDGFFQTPYQINLRTGQFHILNLKPAVDTCRPAHWSLSPDKKWVLWRKGWDHPTTTIFAARLDGRGSRFWTMPENDSADYLWLPHSHRWVSFRVAESPSYAYRDALIHDLDTPKAPPRVVPLPAVVASAEQVVGVLADGRILMAEYPDDTPYMATTVKLFLIDLNAPNRMGQISIALPQGMKCVSSIYLSPNGRSIAWELRDANKKKNAFYVSDLSDQKMRLFKRPPVKSDEGLYLQGWYSDSRSLLFEVMQDKWMPEIDYLCLVAVP